MNSTPGLTFGWKAGHGKLTVLTDQGTDSKAAAQVES
jgi:hypothetical protein